MVENNVQEQCAQTYAKFVINIPITLIDVCAKSVTLPADTIISGAIFVLSVGTEVLLFRHFDLPRWLQES